MKRDAEYIAHQIITAKTPIQMKDMPELNDEFIFSEVCDKLQNVGFKLKCNYNDELFYITSNQIYEEECPSMKSDTLTKDCCAAIVLLWFELIYKGDETVANNEINNMLEEQEIHQNKNEDGQLYIGNSLFDGIDNTVSPDLSSQQADDLDEPTGIVIGGTSRKTVPTTIKKLEFINKYKHKFSSKVQLENRILPILHKKKFIKFSRENILADSALLCYVKRDEMASRLGHNTLDYIAKLSLDKVGKTR